MCPVDGTQAARLSDITVEAGGVELVACSTQICLTKCTCTWRGFPHPALNQAPIGAILTVSHN
jgi:hypothetical protein